MTLKVFLVSGSVVTIDDMSADDFRQLIAQHTDWVPIDSMAINLWSAGHGYINTNAIDTFVEQRE